MCWPIHLNNWIFLRDFEEGYRLEENQQQKFITVIRTVDISTSSAGPKGRARGATAEGPSGGGAQA